MKTFTQEEVKQLLRKASRDIDKSMLLGIFNNATDAMPAWIEANIVNPPNSVEWNTAKKGD